MFSHSGSLSVMIPVAAAAMGINFSKAISCGNECDLNAVDFLEYFGQDPDTEIIIAYMEGVRDGGRFLRLARDISRRKPIIIWKGGKSSAGIRAASSHTGALAGAPEVWGAAFKQAGIVGVDSAEELLDCLQAFRYLPLPEGDRVAVVSGMGGMGVSIADACVEYGMKMAALSEGTRSRLGAVVPAVGTSFDNPIDLGMGSTFNSQMFVDALESLSGDDGVDMIIMTTGSWQPDYVNKVLGVTGAISKPVMLVTTPALKLFMEQPKPAEGLAVYDDGRRAALAMGRLLRYRRYLSGC